MNTNTLHPQTKNQGNERTLTIHQRLDKRVSENDDSVPKSSKQLRKLPFLLVGMLWSVAFMNLTTSLRNEGPRKIKLKLEQKREVELLMDDPSARGPIPFFCNSNFTLYRSQMKDVICNASSSLSSLLPEADRSNLIFIHVPKTGGESMMSTLNLTKNHKVYAGRLSEYESPHVSFTTIRNPFDRMLSWYRFCLHGWMGKLPIPQKHCIKAHETIQAIGEAEGRVRIPGNVVGGIHHPSDLASVAWAFDQWISAIFLDPTVKPHHWLTTPFVSYLGGIQPVLHVDFILRFEHLEADFALLARALGRTNTTLSHENGSKHGGKGCIESPNIFNVTYDEGVIRLLDRPYREVYTPRARDIVQRHFESDLSAFGYQF